jgi:branched-chain amino acid aminotransferase
MTHASAHCWHNGEIRDREGGAPSVASISFHLGTGVFDGMMAYWNGDHYHVLRAEEHVHRFIRGSARMGLSVPWSANQLLTGIHQLLDLEPRATQYIRPIAFRGGPELWVTGSEGRPVDISIFTVRTDGHRDLDSPITCEISRVERISSRSIPGQVKVCGAYVNSFNARRTAEQAGFNDGLMFDRDGHLAEASAANVFLIFGDRLLTPRLKSDVFPGITRLVVMELAADVGIEVEECEITREKLASADGVFVCSTLMELRAVSRLGQREISTLELAPFKKLLGAFRALTRR